MPRVNLTMPDELWARVGEEADRSAGGNRSFVVRRALEATLGEPNPHGYPFEAERQAVKAAVEAGVTEVRVEGGSIMPPQNRGAASPQVSAHVRPAIPKKEK